MADIYLGIGIMVVLSVSCFLLAAWMVRSAPSLICDALGILTLALMFFYMKHIWYHIGLTRILPFSNLIIVGNWFPLAAGFMAGLAWRRVPGGTMRRGIFVFGLGLAALFTVLHPLRGAPPPCLNVWKYGVCLQTSPATCSAASAATLLHAHQISATEEELADLCLTNQGTTWMGLYRGLKKKTAGTSWEVEVFHCSIAELQERTKTSPVLLNVELEKNAAADPRYHEDWGWVPGQPHSVVLFHFWDNERVEIGDPSVGREEWTYDDLAVLWHGQGIQLVQRR